MNYQKLSLTNWLIVAALHIHTKVKQSDPLRFKHLLMLEQIKPGLSSLTSNMEPGCGNRDP